MPSESATGAGRPQCTGAQERASKEKGDGGVGKQGGRRENDDMA